MRDVLGYSGRRVIVTGAVSGVGGIVIARLVDLGAEVHAIDERRPKQPGIASYTDADLREAAEITAAVERIGAIVNDLFHCADEHADFARMVEQVVPIMRVEGSAIAAVASSDAVPSYVKAQAEGLAARGIRINCVEPGPGDLGTEAAVWPLLLLNSPRAAAVTGVVLPLAPLTGPPPTPTVEPA
jgi:NAD(P)-dependent dehydrogenase (short-subunit alcohol dehydrogenase family)